MAFMSGRLIFLDKRPGIHPIGLGEIRGNLFSNCVRRVKGLKSTYSCQDDQICAGLKAGIDGVIHGVQDIWDSREGVTQGYPLDMFAYGI